MAKCRIHDSRARRLADHIRLKISPIILSHFLFLMMGGGDIKAIKGTLYTGRKVGIMVGPAKNKTLTSKPSFSMTRAAAPLYVTLASYAADACFVVFNTRMELEHTSDETDDARPIAAFLSSIHAMAEGFLTRPLR